MVINLSEEHSLVSNWVNELRDIHIQNDKLRFRRNLEKIGEVCAYEISKKLNWKEISVTTPLGIASSKVLSEQPVLATILRAGLPMHQGMLNYFDRADNAFISAYRKHDKSGNFDICLDYISCPVLTNRVVIISDPMLATGASLIKTLQFIREQGRPSAIYIACAIACRPGINRLKKIEPDAFILCGDIDEEISEKGYIIPGLGDAGDLAYGIKMQQ